MKVMYQNNSAAMGFKEFRVLVRRDDEILQFLLN